MSDKKAAEVNYGIQANSVTAGAIAAGSGAQATQNTYSGFDASEVRVVFDEFRSALSRSGLPESAQITIAADAAAVKAECERADPNKCIIEGLLKNLAEKIKLAGQIATGAADLIEPIKKMAAAVGLGASIAAMF